MQHSNFFEDNGFFEFSSKPRYEQIKDFQFLKNEKDLQKFVFSILAKKL